ncbi:uncharacterized protein LOC117168563 [Belonocnema kinseyi]|uniref:uncharacterized protein LOC117168563 n=1 Tax=Belonocnema kinseyi TaxID=2817044 RepID=UPI00143DB155|nr:uncharacterized protein LOC117168563 [Belonocnema kinseyi]
MGGKSLRYRGKKKRPINETRIPSQETSEIKKVDPRCSKPHRLIVTDKKTDIPFLLAPDAQVSLFPKFLIEENSKDINNRIEHSDVLVDSSGTIIYTSGQITLTIDLGLGKLFSWKFTLVNFERPIIGRDFLSHFQLQINFQRMCLMNVEAGLETTRISTVACECHRNDNSDDGWPNITAIFKRSIKHRNHIIDKNSNKAFLVGFSSQVSVFPKSEVNDEDLEPFNGSFELHWLSGKVAHVLGWNIQKLDFGLGREFTWKFAVIDIDKPIIGFDFINYFGLTQQLKMGYLSLFDSETNMATPAPSGPCDCGHFREGWPKSCFLIPACPEHNTEPSSVFKELLTEVQSSKENTEPLRKSNQNLKESSPNSEASNGTLKPFSQNSRGFQLTKEKSETLKSSELSEADLEPVNEKSTKFDQYPEPFTRNPKTFHQRFRELELLNKSTEPLSQSSKESNQYPQPFNQNLKPFSQSSRVLQPVEKIPTPFTQNPKESNKISIDKRSIESPNQNFKETQQDRLEMFREKEEISKPVEKPPRGSNRNFMKLDNKYNLKEDSRNAGNEFGSNNKKSTLPRNENPHDKVKEQPRTISKHSLNLGIRSNLKEDSRSATKESGSVSEKSASPRNENFKDKAKDQPRASKANSSKLDIKSNLKEYYKNERDEFEAVNKKSTSPKNENPQDKTKDQPRANNRNSSKLDNKSNLKENAREESGSINKKSASPKNENPQYKLKDQPRANNRNSSKLENRSNLKEDYRNERDESKAVNKKSTSPKNENSQDKSQDQPQENNKNSLKQDSKSNLKEDSRNAREESGTIIKKLTSPKKENSQDKLKEELQTSNRNVSNLDNKFNIKHRFHVTDIETKLHFLIGTESELSVFPQERVRKERREPFDGSFEVSGGFGKIEKIFGWTTQVIDIGLGRKFTWKFALINIGKPILGWDFISHFGLSFHTGGLLDLETKITAPPPDGPCDCGSINDGWPTFVNFMKVPIKEKPNRIEEESVLVSEAAAIKDDSQLALSDNNSTPSKRRRSKKKVKSTEDDTQTKAEEEESTAVESSTSTAKGPLSTSKEEKTEAKISEISNTLSQVDHEFPIKHCFHITEKETKISFLIDTQSEISVFPASKMGKKPLETRQDSYEIVECDGTVVPVLGWTTRTLDIGIGERFSWQLAVIDSAKTILSRNFLEKFNLGINHKKQIIYNKYGRFSKFLSEPCNCPESNLTSSTSLKIRLVPHTIKHHFHLLDKNSNMLFFVSQMSEVSFVPRCQIPRCFMEVSKNSEIIDCARVVLPVYGYVTLKIDFGLEREFEWKFAVAETLRPIIGLDFLKNFDLKTHRTEYPRLVDPETKMETSKYTGSCDCGDTFDFPVLMFLRKLDLASEEFPVQTKLDNNVTHCSDDRCPKEGRIILVERETGMPYLLSGAKMSVFPESEANKEDIEPFDNSFDLVQMNGSVVAVHGWINRKLDFGLGRYFFWKFAVINIGRPLLANDFLHHYDFVVSYKGRSVFDEVTSKTVVGSTDFCECQARHFWPDISSMGIKFKWTNKASPNRMRRGTMEDSTSSDEDDYLKTELPSPVESSENI